MHLPSSNDHTATCKSCGGTLTRFVTVPAKSDRERHHPEVTYFKCENCAHVQIVDQ